MIEPTLSDILEFAVALTLDAGRFILPLWKNVTVEHKADASEVTEADRGAERLLRTRIAERYPGHAILGEELGGKQDHEAEHLWLLDPIDGTASFAIGLPMFGTLVAYLRRGTPCVGVIGAHAMRELVYAATDQGCWYQRGKRKPIRVHTSAVADPAQALVVSTTLEHTDMDPRDPVPAVCLSRLYRKARRFRWSGDCINYALLCRGQVDVALDSRMHPWDTAALIPCVREAGGVMTSLDGKETVIWEPDLVASANQRLHTQVLELLRSEPFLDEVVTNFDEHKS